MRIFSFILLLVLHPMSWGQEASLQMVGEARLQFMFWPVYDSRLFTPGGDYRQGQRPLRFEIEYRRNVNAQDLVSRTRDEWERQQPISMTEQQWLQELARIWPDVAENDVLVLEINAQGESTFLINGSTLGAIAEPAFGERFLDIWLSPNTSRPELRLGLLGMN
jgi:hypothetical protein